MEHIVHIAPEANIGSAKVHVKGLKGCVSEENCQSKYKLNWPRLQRVRRRKRVQWRPSQRPVEQFKEDHAFEEFKDKSEFNEDHTFEEFKVESEFNDDYAF